MKLPPKAQAEVTVDTVLFTIEEAQLKVILVKRETPPAKGTLSLPGGFIWKSETSTEAAKRVLNTKLGLSDDVFLEQLYTFDNPKRDPRGQVITIAYFALTPIEHLKNLLEANIRAVNTDNVGALAFDHNEIVAYAIKRLRTKLGYSNVAYSLLPKLFTLSQLQEVYEVILGHPIDKRNFRKKILSLDIIESTNQELRGQRHRPARLFKFKKRSYSELEEPIF